jgi:predicted transcriptional regulator
MENKKYVMLDLDDERIASLSNVLGNKTCKKILDYLAEKEASETQIANDLKMPANTVNYNIKQLLDAGLIEKTKTFFWSVKGKKVPTYTIANKKIVISPKNFANRKALLLTGAISAVGAIFIKSY